MRKRVRAQLLLAAVFHLIVLGHAARAQFRDTPLRVRFTPVIRDYVSGASWTAMTAECDQIWSVQGVEIGWRADRTDATPEVTLPLVFDDRELQTHDPSRREDAFGITLFSGRTQRVLVSIGRVRNLVAARRQLADSDDSTIRDMAVGRLLGRVVAHELGHVLLLTTAHAHQGLMSASLSGRSLGPFEPARFALSAAERDRLATRFSTSPHGEQRADASTITPPGGPASDDAVAIPIASRNVPTARSPLPATR